MTRKKYNQCYRTSDIQQAAGGTLHKFSVCDFVLATKKMARTKQEARRARAAENERRVRHRPQLNNQENFVWEARMRALNRAIAEFRDSIHELPMTASARNEVLRGLSHMTRLASRIADTVQAPHEEQAQDQEEAPAQE